MTRFANPSFFFAFTILAFACAQTGQDEREVSQPLAEADALFEQGKYAEAQVAYEAILTQAQAFKPEDLKDPKVRAQYIATRRSPVPKAANLGLVKSVAMLEGDETALVVLRILWPGYSAEYADVLTAEDLRALQDWLAEKGFNHCVAEVAAERKRRAAAEPGSD